MDERIEKWLYDIRFAIDYAISLFIRMTVFQMKIFGR